MFWKYLQFRLQYDIHFQLDDENIVLRSSAYSGCVSLGVLRTEQREEERARDNITGGV